MPTFPFIRIRPDTLASLMADLSAIPCSAPMALEISTLDKSLGIQHLADSERKTYDTFRFPKRRREWLAGRFCAKAALTDYIQKFHPLQRLPAPEDILICSHETGRPFFGTTTLPDEFPRADLSISHSGQYGLALVCKTLCGVDIQIITPSLTKIKEKYCTRTEEGVLDQLRSPGDFSSLEALGLLWVAKEGVRKMLSGHRLLGFLEMVLETATPLDHGSWLFRLRVPAALCPQTHVKVLTLFHLDYAIGFCIGEDFHA